jgi:16S rRNA (cytosine967-C5)-methyltransferase
MDRAVHAVCQRMPSDDRALAIAIAGDALRWLEPLDALIDGATDQRLPDDSKVRSVLRIALTQLLRLRTPPHAVISTSLALLVGGPRRLAHAILSRAQRDGWALDEIPPLPAAAADRWNSAWGPEVVAAASANWATPPALDLRFKTPADALAYGEGAALAPCHRRLARAGRVEALPGYADGNWWVQDLAAGIAADLLGYGEGRTVLDLCAAPGGKTMQLAAAGWHVTAVDSNARRLERLDENLSRTGLSATTVIAKLQDYRPEQVFNAVLLDAPCSATGTFRRHPDVLHRIGLADIAALAALQRDLLARAAAWVRPGGLLVYATCSLEPQEGEEIASAFLADRPEWQKFSITAAELPTGVTPTDAGFVRTLPTNAPDKPQLDGFFVARFRAP